MITLEKLTKRFGPKILFENVSMRFDPGKRYALVGANGAGKSTLLKVISGEQDSDYGTVEIPKRLRVGVLKQDHFAYEDVKILDAVLMGNKVLWDAMHEKDRLLEGEMTDEIGMRLAELAGTIGEEDGYMAESNAAEILEGLGIASDRHQDPVSTLAGGYKLRVLIAQTLFGGADVLLLDEPTNHLDLDSIRWLESYLTDTFRGTLVVVSHDRHFMNAIATHVADVDYQTVTTYTGDYDDFIVQKTTGARQLSAETAATKKKIGELKDFVSRFGASASRASQAQARVKEIEKLQATLTVRRSSVVRPYIRFDIDKPSGRDVLRVTGLSKSFGDKKVLDGLDFNLNRGDKMAVIGPSGIGKSTLLKCLVSEYVPDAGTVIWGHETNIGYFAQDHHEALEAGYSAYEWLHRFDPLADLETVRAVLGRLLFSGDAGLKRTETLSGGEAARLLLAKLILLKNNVVVLDEPTNHLDVESIDALVEALVGYKGTVVMTSHDRHFVSKIGTRVLALTRIGPQLFNGTYEEYLETHGDEHLRH